MHCSRVTCNWKINITTGGATWERRVKFGNAILEISGKKIAAFLWRVLFPVSGLSRIIRAVGNHVPIKVRIIISHKSIAEMALLVITRPVKLYA